MTCAPTYAEELDALVLDAEGVTRVAQEGKSAQGFMSVDPMADQAPGWTPYRYAFNDPINYIDPDGLFETKADAKQYAKDNDIKTGFLRRNKIRSDGDSYVIENKKERSVTMEFDGRVITGGMALEQNQVDLAGGLAVAAVVSQADSPAPGPADVVAAVGATVLTLAYLETLIPVTGPDFTVPTIMDPYIVESNKNSRHGDQGRSASKAERDIADLQQKLKNATGRAKKQIQQKIKNIQRNVDRAKRGEEHGRNAKGN